MPLIELRGASVFLGNTPVLRGLDWQLERGAHFAITGANGAGKSTFLRLIAGRIWPRPHDSRFYNFGSGFGSGRTWSPLRARPQIALLSPEIQERFVRQGRDGPDNESGWRLDARRAILAGLFDSELLHQKPDAAQEKRADALIADLRLEPLALRPLQSLSQGEMRRVLLARALVSQPEVLLLDEACSGLDSGSRAEMLEMLEIIARSGSTTLGLTTHREDEIVAAVKNVFRLEKGKLVTSISASFPQKMKPILPGAPQSPTALDSTLIELQNASVWLDGTPILCDLNWQWRRGQHFALEGENGGGKTTFLRLLRGELHPARAGKIVRFGEDRLQSRSAIGERIALLSPALQAIYEGEISVETAVESGFFDGFGVVGELSISQRAQVRQILEICELTALSGRVFARLSHGQRRRVLLARALVSAPPVLLLDEALDGLDGRGRAQFQAILAGCATRGTHLMIVSHHESDYPPFLTHRLRLENGEITANQTF